MLGYDTTSTQVQSLGIAERVPPFARTLQASSGGGVVRMISTCPRQATTTR